MSLSICQNCGEESDGPVCGNCGAATGAATDQARVRVPPQSSPQPRPRPLKPPKPRNHRLHKGLYLDRIREESAYPLFRTLNLITAGLLCVFGAVLLGLSLFLFTQAGVAMVQVIIGGFTGVLLIVFGL